MQVRNIIQHSSPSHEILSLSLIIIGDKESFMQIRLALSIAIFVLMISANTMGQDYRMEQRIGQCQSKECSSMMNTCPGETTCTMMQPMMGTCPDNDSCVIMQPIIGACSTNKTCVMIEPITENCLANKTCLMMMQTGKCPGNKKCMTLEALTGACPPNSTCYDIEVQKPANVSAFNQNILSFLIRHL
jgi:hypothetical protein